VEYRVCAIAEGLRSIPSKPASIVLVSGLDTRDLAEEARIYPNPFEGYFTFEYKSPRAQDLQLRLLDLRGMLMADLSKVVVESGTNHIALAAEGFSPGFYFLEYRSGGNKVGYLKLIKN
jgi:hypothetical protein